VTTWTSRPIKPLQYQQSADLSRIGTATECNATEKPTFSTASTRTRNRGAGLAYWTTGLASGQMDRGDVLLGFSESMEHQIKTAGVIDHGIWII
jgi:hypothetical protein